MSSVASQVAQWKRICLPKQETQIQSLVLEDPLEKEMATYSSILAWEIPWTEEPGGLQSTGSQRVGHDLATKTTMMFSVLEQKTSLKVQKTSLLSSSVKLQQIFKIYTSFS